MTCRIENPEMIEVSKEMEGKARTALMDKLWEQFEQFSEEEIREGRGASASVEVDGVWFHTATELSTGIPEDADIDAHLEWLCNEALNRIQCGKTSADAASLFHSMYHFM